MKFEAMSGPINPIQSGLFLGVWAGGEEAESTRGP